MSQSIPFLQSFLSLLFLLLCTNDAFCEPLVNFQVAQPLPFVLDSDSLQCTTTILQRTFGSSIGEYATITWSFTVYLLMLVNSSPEIVQYIPPTGCGTPDVWAGVTLNFTVAINGTQYPRLAFLPSRTSKTGRIVWRSSAPIPGGSGPDGIIWTYVKDVTRFIPLFSNPGIFILQLDNVVQPGLDGEFAASVPPGFSVEVTLPRNAVTAFAELQALENDDEVLWFTNVPNQFLNLFPVGIVADNGPFREVRVLVDGQVAGVAFPYAFFSTGIVVSSAWRPITSYGAIDIPTYHLDLTPFIPILTNGQPHNITLDVASAEPDHQINQTWYLSGLLQVNLDSSTSPTTGNITLYQADDYAVSTATGSNDGDINIIVNASRSVHIEAEIIAGSGEQTKVVFTQNLEYGNVNTFPKLRPSYVFQIASGKTLSTHNGKTALEDTFTYPLIVDFMLPDRTDVTAQIDHAYSRVLLPAPFIMGTTIMEHQVAAGTVVSWDGTSNNTFSYNDTEGNTYTRQVNASSNVIVFDNQGGTLAPNTSS
ncbi:peptide N-acetyl-beta-D-glucosaminyl asparaginase amidase A-domain-containing protein [Lactarius hengduanensis]|nr:peptide N-acetyl-beta-D-glucosaminyl asparaginase amidase A-domain-containing protein [Lactarius hengduanensis]